MPSDKSALGTLPLPAFQFCEAVRVATSAGWYIFPPKNAIISYDGQSTFIECEDGKTQLGSELTGPEFTALWNSRCPVDLKDQEIAWLSYLNYPGHIQVWSGYFVETAPGWHLWIKPITNYIGPDALRCYEGIIETDTFKPAPLFANFRISKTDVNIKIDTMTPLFQVVPILAESFIHADAEETNVLESVEQSKQFDWHGYSQTTSSADDPKTNLGSYGARVRAAKKRRLRDAQSSD